MWFVFLRHFIMSIIECAGFNNTGTCEHVNIGEGDSELTATNSTLTTSQGSDTVTSIFKCNSSNTVESLRLLKMA